MNTNEKAQSASKAKCPKCKSNNLLLQEIWVGHFIEWEQLDGVFEKDDGVLEAGGPDHVVGECKDCRHTWKFRKVNQISDLII